MFCIEESKQRKQSKYNTALADAVALNHLLIELTHSNAQSPIAVSRYFAELEPPVPQSTYRTYAKELHAAVVACKDVIMQSTAVTPAEVPPGRCFLILFDDLPFTPVYVHSKPDSGVAGVQVRWVKQGGGMPQFYNIEDEEDFDSLALRHLPEPGGSVWEELLAAYKAANKR